MRPSISMRQKPGALSSAARPALATPPLQSPPALMLELARRVGYENMRLKAGAVWQSTIGLDLEGLTLALLGLGKLGTRMAEIGRAFKMHVIAWSQNLTPEKCREAGAEYVSSDELFRRADFLSIHVQLSSRTRGLIGARAIRPDEKEFLSDQYLAWPDSR